VHFVRYLNMWAIVVISGSSDFDSRFTVIRKPKDLNARLKEVGGRRAPHLEDLIPFVKNNARLRRAIDF
jgi:hypothetical protein